MRRGLCLSIATLLGASACGAEPLSPAEIEAVVSAATCAEPDKDVFHLKSVVIDERRLSYFEVPRDQRPELDYTIEFLRRTSEPVGAWTCDILPGPGGWYCDNGKEYVQCVHYSTGPKCDSGTVDPDPNPSGCGA